MSRSIEVKRSTRETTIYLFLDIDGKGDARISTSCKFLDHMLTLLAKHAKFDIYIKAEGDLIHHLVEDVAIVLGSAFLKTLGEKRGIERYGHAYVPMDETLALCAVDLSGRSYFHIDFKFSQNQIEDITSEDIIHFMESFAMNAKINLHLLVLYGENNHHKAEAGFKALARALKQAVKITSDEIPSSKGIL